MATILKCKMCGGDIEVSQDMTVGKCLFCGSIMTLPKIDSEKKARLFNRANEYRLNNEFDKAYDAYKTITEEDEQESEAYWGMILSEYGVEYVEDPSTHKRIPTCHRTKIQSIQSTTNYDFACKYADSESRFIYQDEAEEIDRIQKRILSISSKEEPYDVFICYKETDIITGERTKDSIIAQEIYSELSREGLKVFFSRITLEDKLGQDFEPYIFSALNSAKVMIVVTTSNENVNSVWVKNEWSRFLRFIQENSNKVMIPVFQGMEAYELPDELSKFQSQNYDKIGALQDICHSVKKLVSLEERQQKDSLIDDIIQDRIKSEQKKNERIVRGKRAAALTKKIAVITAIVLAVMIFIFGGILLYKKVVKPSITYNRAVALRDDKNYEQAIELYSQVEEYRDSKEQIIECQYSMAVNWLENGKEEEAKKLIEELNRNTEGDSRIEEYKYNLALECINNKKYDLAEVLLKSLGEYKDCIDKISLCKLEKAKEIYAEGKYTDAYLAFSNVGDGPYLEEAKENMYKCSYEIQMGMDKKSQFLGNYAEEMPKEMIYNMGLHMMEVKEYAVAEEFFGNCLEYNDSADLWKESAYLEIKDTPESSVKLQSLYDIGFGIQLKKLYTGLQDSKCIYNPAKDDFEKLASKYYDEAMEEFNKTNWETAKKKFNNFSGVEYKDVTDLVEQCDENMKNEKALFEGTWVENTRFWTNLKIVDGVVYTTSDKIENPDAEWRKQQSTFDGDTGLITFTFGVTKYRYEAKVNGNSLTLKWINQKNQWETDWFQRWTNFTRYTK